jgi:hypothetical protein
MSKLYNDVKNATCFACGDMIKKSSILICHECLDQAEKDCEDFDKLASLEEEIEVTVTDDQ